MNCDKLWINLSPSLCIDFYFSYSGTFRTAVSHPKAYVTLAQNMFYKVNFFPLIITLSQVWEKFNLKRFIGNLFQSWWNLPCKTCWIGIMTFLSDTKWQQNFLVCPKPDFLKSSIIKTLTSFYQFVIFISSLPGH